MSLLSIVLILAAAPSTEVIDDAVRQAEDHEVSVLRAEARGRGGISLAGSAAVGFATRALAFGVGLSADAGLIFADRYAITLRLTGTIFLLLSAGLQFEISLSERVLFGIGASWGASEGSTHPARRTSAYPRA